MAPTAEIQEDSKGYESEGSTAESECCSSRGACPTALINYSEPQPPGSGKLDGRYVGCEDTGAYTETPAPARMPMRDARLLPQPATLARQGFAMREWPSAVKDWSDTSEVESVYFEEMQELLRQATGAFKVKVIDWTRRSSEGQAALNKHGVKEKPVIASAHTDYTDASAILRVAQMSQAGCHFGGGGGSASSILPRDDVPPGTLEEVRAQASDAQAAPELSQEEAEEVEGRRFAIINVWRSIAEEPIQQMPLALVDSRSFDPELDTFTYQMVYPDRLVEYCRAIMRPAHEWYYYPRMEKQECLIFKNYDSDRGAARTLHTAVADPEEPPDAPPRQSIEVRAVCWFRSAEDGASRQ